MSGEAVNKPVVFVVDDEQENVDIMVRALGADYDLRPFTSSEEALASALKTRPLVMIVDYRMPKLDGLELVRRVRQAGITFSVVLVTAFAELDEVVYAEQTHLVYRVIRKPLSRDELRTQVELAVGEAMYRQAQLSQRLR